MKIDIKNLTEKAVKAMHVDFAKKVSKNETKSNNMLKFLKRFAHNKLGWGYPVGMVEKDAFQPVYKCECGGRVTQDSTGAWFHLGRPNKI